MQKNILQVRTKCASNYNRYGWEQFFLQEDQLQIYFKNNPFDNYASQNINNFTVHRFFSYFQTNHINAFNISFVKRYRQQIQEKKSEYTVQRIVEVVRFIALKQRFITNISLRQTHNATLTFILQKCEWIFISFIHLGKNTVNEEGVKLLLKSNLKYLRQLEIFSNPIGNKGIKHISKLQSPFLQSLFFDKVHVTTDAINYLKKMRKREAIEICISFTTLNQDILRKIAYLNFKKFYILNYDFFINHTDNNIIVKCKDFETQIRSLELTSQIQTKQPTRIILAAVHFRKIPIY